MNTTLVQIKRGLTQTRDIQLSQALEVFGDSDWLNYTRQSLLANKGADDESLSSITLLLKNFKLEEIKVSYDEALINELFAKTAIVKDLPEHLASDLMAHITNNFAEMDVNCVKIYQNMLNRHFHFKTIFIFDSELVDKIREAYNFIGSPRNSNDNGSDSEVVQEIFAEIHRQTDGNFLSDYKRLLFTV